MSARASQDLLVKLDLGEKHRIHRVLHMLLHMGSTFQGAEPVLRELDLQGPIGGGDLLCATPTGGS